MLKTIAGLQGVTVLSKVAQKKIGGGVTGICAVRVSGGSYGGATGILDFGEQSSGGGASSAANSWCVNHIAQYGGRCQYDCAHDGYSAPWL
jgi:hypothetical protein